MEKETLFVAFSTQKGGAGKTALTVLTSSYMHYVLGKSIAIVDCDYPQYSIMEMRKRDKDLVMMDDYFKLLAYNQFRGLEKKAYPVVMSDPVNAIDTANKVIKDSPVKFDIIFFDLPGTMNSKGVVQTLSSMDYIFAPISADRLVLESTLTFASSINENLMSVNKSNIKGLFLLWNMVDGREKTDLYGVYEKVINELGLPLLKTFIPDTKRFRKEINGVQKQVFRSTLFPPDKQLVKGSNIDMLVDEICQILKV
ncbi:ParA family protein [Dysgonomonas sp. 521]|uniref:ParA family protein n=1 Tax=Dysgonomonas sp. 521 TaxID=2302932 RepID=UPI0013D04522|nr:ParA family protein [Dysgonomonas sp. 521]NDV97318.1 ParA family protein [Dysgonomonas sp. 521]